MEQQQNTRDALRSLAHLVSASALATKQTWPLVTVPLYELHAEDAIVQGRTEFLAIWHRVTVASVDAFTNYTANNYQQMMHDAHMLRSGNLDRLNNDSSFYKPFISKAVPGKGYLPDDEREEYWPGWQFTPVPFTYGSINWNVASVPPVGMAINAMLKLQYETTLTPVMPYRSADVVFTREEHAAMHSKLKDSTPEHPHVFAFHPVHEDPLNYDSNIVATVSGAVALDAAFLDLLPTGVNGIVCVIKNNMNQTFTYEIDGHDAIYQGEGDRHETKYDDMSIEVSLALHSHPDYLATPGHAQYQMKIYPSATFEAAYDSNTPEVYASVVAVTFALVALVFFVYDLFQFRRNENLVSKAAQSNALVSSLFPDHMKERLMREKEEAQRLQDNKKGNLKSFLNVGRDAGIDTKDQKPLADLFLDTTVLMADCTGFTAWSSVREPSQVFVLLE